MRGCRIKGFQFLIDCLLHLSERVNIICRLEKSKSKYYEDLKYNEMISKDILQEYTSFILKKINTELYLANLRITEFEVYDKDKGYFTKEKLLRNENYYYISNDLLYCSCLRPIYLGLSK